VVVLYLGLLDVRIAGIEETCVARMVINFTEANVLLLFVQGHR
jgi:hypothetical protein